MNTNVEEASRALAEELAMKPHEAADLTARLYELKNKTVRLVTSTGEKLSESEWARETEELKAGLRAYIERFGQDNKGRYMTVSVEGQPDLELMPRNSEEIETNALFADDPELFHALLEHGAVRVDVKAAKALMPAFPALWERLKGWIHPMGLTPSLGFKREAR